MFKEDKRKISSTLRTILAVDAYLTNTFVNWAQQFLILRQLKIHHTLLRISCNSVVWLVTNLVMIWALNNPNLYQMQVNLLIGLSLDIVLVAVLKAATRRRRPTTNDNFSPNKDSFPSGHAARVAFITFFFLNLYPVPLICVPPLLAWSFSVCISKLLTREHHIVDVLAGIAVGIFQGMLIGYIYLERETCTSLVWWITDEKISGAEYDV
ncbi:polyisoprenoid diphosphate/phosphate phosphohydrolase PLPP6-like isoform X1 [Cataglyphis hispanica]|uniref:polyisoprenoid diphosphate/phosphate phosphohydrolase PLPP6-like isoform X1 n=1 Tax=Cataglyphis hispanica TaxID=1086592 RepID=UPI00217FDCB7|nr:polyisoprenoid diphosphate/phosphate phosphohydrolase PLPP6-like isoform X1 [Cataglyphis hispanica]